MNVLYVKFRVGVQRKKTHKCIFYRITYKNIHSQNGNSLVLRATEWKKSIFTSELFHCEFFMMKCRLRMIGLKLGSEIKVEMISKKKNYFPEEFPI